MALALLSCEAVWAVYPQTKTLDDGNLTLFILNTGSFGFDPEETRGDVTGLYYPGGSFKGIMAGGGIWVTGKKHDEWRITISGDESEFVPGPVGADGLPADTTFRIYRLTRGEDYALSDDYRNWPVTLGAPVDAFGRPLVRGSQALFTMFNDADSAAHIFTGFAGTPPLGVEVRCYAHTWDNNYQQFDTMMTQVVFLDFSITNIGDGPIDSCIVSLYSDPDIGYSENDLVGSNAELQCAYVYDEADSDPIYGDSPPVVGLAFLENTAASMNFYYRCRLSYPECEAVDTLPKLLNIVRGLRPGGQPYIDPTTLEETTFPFGGDPVADSGWIGTNSRDYRFILNTQPIDLAVGDSIKFKTALVVARGNSTKNGILRFLETVRLLRDLEHSDTLAPKIAASRYNAVEVRGHRLIGYDWGGRFLGGGVDLASRYLPYAAAVPLSNPAELIFDSRNDDRLFRFVENGTNLEYAGELTGTGIMLKSQDQRLKCIVLDLDHDGKLTDKDGKLDPLILTGLDYEFGSFGPVGTNLSKFAEDLQFVVHLDQTLKEIGRTTIGLAAERMSEEFSSLPNSIVVGEPASEAPSEVILEITNNTGFVQAMNLLSSEPASVGFLPSDFELGIGESRFVSMQSTAGYDPAREVTISLYSYGLNNEFLTVPVDILPAQTTVSGDADNSGKLDLADVLRMIRILYRDDPISTPLRQLDANCDLRFGLVDVVAYINFLYLHSELPCKSGMN